MKTHGSDKPAMTRQSLDPAVPPRRGLLRTAMRCVLIAAMALAVFAAGFAAFAGHVGGMRTPDATGTADAIIVLTGGHSRIGAAVDLLRAGKGRRLLISGVNPVADLDDLRRATGGERALFSCCVDIDHAALDTVGNAAESIKWMARHAYGSAIVVTNNYHMPRSLLELRRVSSGIDLVPYPVVNSRLDGGAWMVHPAAWRVLFTEYTKYVAALARSVVPARDAALATIALAPDGARE